MTEQQITNDGNVNRYFAMIPHMATDELNPYQLSLYVHYVRVCGAGGKCFEGTRTTARKTQMSAAKVSTTRRELEQLGYISIEEREQDTLLITIIDRMLENVTRYNKCSCGEQGCSCGEHKKKPSKKKEDSTGNGADAPPAVVPPSKEWYTDKAIMALPLEERLDEWRSYLDDITMPPLARRRKKDYTKTFVYRMLERIIKHEAAFPQKKGILLGQACHWFWHEVEFSFDDLLDFIRWHRATYPTLDLPHKLAGDGQKTQGWKDYWQAWQAAAWATILIAAPDCKRCHGAGQLSRREGNDIQAVPCGCTSEHRVRKETA